MSRIQPNDRVVCIDATPIPIGAPGHPASDFSFPGGFIAEGQIYCVSRAKPLPDGCLGLEIVGHPVLLLGHEIPWNSSRFRKVAKKHDPQSLTQAEPETASLQLQHST